MVKSPIVKESIPYIIILAALVISAYQWLPFPFNLVSILPLPLLGFILYFFRNPERHIPQGENLILSPADGRVMEISEVYEERFMHQQAIKISIFMSPFNVHINRSPISGEIKYQQYTCGRFRPAYKDQVGCDNERHSLGIENRDTKVMVTQIAGILARRIVSWVTIGRHLEAGQRYGMIKFSSCTELIIPMNVEILVQKGDRVRGGESIVAKINSDG